MAGARTKKKTQIERLKAAIKAERKRRKATNELMKVLNLEIKKLVNTASKWKTSKTCK